MRFSVGLTLFCLGLLLDIVSGVCRNCDVEIREAKIIPDVVKSCDSTDLKVVYPIMGKKVNCGNDVSILQTLLPPTITFDKPVKCKYVTVLLYAPSIGQLIQRSTPFLHSDEPIKVGAAHWIVHNVPADELKKGFNGKAGDTKFPYLIPLGPFGGHFYNFFVFCQKSKIPTQGTPYVPVVDLLQRDNFHIDDFQTKNNLDDPIACNFLKLTLL